MSQKTFPFTLFLFLWGELYLRMRFITTANNDSKTEAKNEWELMPLFLLNSLDISNDFKLLFTL